MTMQIAPGTVIHQTTLDMEDLARELGMRDMTIIQQNARLRAYAARVAELEALVPKSEKPAAEPAA